MKVVDKLFDFIRLNDPDDMDNSDYLDDDYDSDEYEEERPQRRILKKYDEEEDTEEEEPAAKAKPQADWAGQDRSASAQKQARPRVIKNTSSKVSPMRSKRGGGMEVCVIKPKSMEDAKEITETLLEECTVILNMEGLDRELAQRIIDFSGGSCYAVKGKLQKINGNIFVITPESVDISGDFQDMLNGAFDVPSYGTRF